MQILWWGQGGSKGTWQFCLKDLSSTKLIE